jgi:hypothetical protein
MGFGSFRGLFAAFGVGGRDRPLLSALRAGVLSFASPKESSQRKGDPSVGAPAGFLALLGEPGGSHELACGSNNANRLPPARLRCSAPRKGTRKASRNLAPSKELNAAIAQEVEPKVESGWFAGTLGRCRATQVLAEKGRGLFEGRSPEFRSPRQRRVAQGTPEGGTDPGSPFLCLLSFGEAKESETPRKGGKHRMQSEPMSA